MFSLKNLVKIGFSLSLVALIALVALYFSIKDELPSVESLKDIKWQTPMQIYSLDNKLISQFGEKKRVPLSLDDIPQQLINAILATEDDRFYQHFGIDPIGIGRAIFGKIIGQNKGGGSTITMQVARNFFLTREVTYTRKIREIFISFHIESLLTKDEILTLYLNKIELGHRAFGFGAAAQVYYGKTVKELTLAQIAVLAGLPKAPSTLNPIRSPERAKARRKVVLQRMLVSGYITESEYEEAKNAPITGKKHGAEIELDAPYVAEMIHQEMISRYGKEDAYTGGYKVFSTVPSQLQQAAKNSVIKNLLNYDKRHGFRGPIKSIRPQLRPELSGGKPISIKEYAEIESEIIPIEKSEIVEVLDNALVIDPLMPALVLHVNEKSAEVAISADETVLIEWQHMAWARLFINDQKQGAPPKSAHQILKIGDLIWVEQKDNIFTLSQLPQASSALVSISPKNGAIKAVVGGFSFKQSQFNRVTQAKRQVGSNIKPFIYSAAIEQGFTLASIVNDAPINQWDRRSGVVWRPKNSPPTYQGPIRVRLALAQSKNVIAVRLLREVGLDNIISHLSSFGFAPDELPRDESLALGSASLTPLEVVTGFSAFANGGFIVSPYFIERIEDSFGNIVFQANPSLACDPCINDTIETQLTTDESTIANSTEIADELMFDESQSIEKIEIKQAERAISPQNAFLITEALNSAIWGADWSVKPGWQGTGFRGRALKRRDIAGKTGTTNEAKDAWFSGYSRHIATTSWIGFDDHRRNLGQSTFNSNLGKNQITGKEFGAKSAQPAWIDYMKVALENEPIEGFQPPEDIVSVRIDKATGKLSTKTDKTSLFEYFINGTEPTEFVTIDKSSTILDGEETPKEEEIF